MSDRSKLQKAARRKRRWMRRTKPARHLAALLGGYFWLPCRLCSEYSGGQEWVNRISIPTGPHSSEGVCPACELDLGLAAIGMCERDGHERVERYGSAGTLVSDGQGHHLGTFTIDTTTPTEVYCGTCGIDLP